MIDWKERKRETMSTNFESDRNVSLGESTDGFRTTENDREYLLRDLRRWRGILTCVEYDYVRNLFLNGDEIAVRRVSSRLHDHDLFFIPNGIIGSSYADGESRASLQEQVSITSDEHSYNHMFDHDRRRGLISELTCDSSERLKHLEERRCSTSLIRKIWLAHSKGIKISRQASQRSLSSRRTNEKVIYKRNINFTKQSSQQSTDTMYKYITSSDNDFHRKMEIIENHPTSRAGDFHIPWNTIIPSFDEGAFDNNSFSAFESESPPIRQTISLREDSSVYEVEQSSQLEGIFRSPASSITLRSSSGSDIERSSTSFPLLPESTAGWISRGEQDTESDVIADSCLKEALGSRPVLVRTASENFYQGEGIEVADFKVKESLDDFRRIVTLQTFGIDRDVTIQSSCSFDETMAFDRLSDTFKRTIHRSLSDENITSDITYLYLATSRFEKLKNAQNSLAFYDAWEGVDHEYGGLGSLRDRESFMILGTSGKDPSTQPHVLSPPLMESLLQALPYSIQGDNFWLKYSLVRDGSSMYTLLQHARGAKHSLLALETIDGEVFGAFTTDPWRRNKNYFGGANCFLWKLRHSRRNKCLSLIDQVQKEGEIEVFRNSGRNAFFQLCTDYYLALGGGSMTSYPSEMVGMRFVSECDQWGFGLSLQADLVHGTSCPSVTFLNPPLSSVHSDGSLFELINVELWALTPCCDENEAQKLEFNHLFFDEHKHCSLHS